MDIKEEILTFIRREEETGALLITGKWGSGKTYYIKNLANKLNEAKKEYLCIISLFGIDSLASLAKVVKERYLDANSNGFTRAVRKVGNITKTVVNATGEIATIATAGNPIAAGIKTGISSVLSINIFDLFSVKNYIGNGKNQRKFVLVFDDLERCKINIVDLLGGINEYCENRNIKTIILAEEDIIKETLDQNKNSDKGFDNIKESKKVTEYDEFKEKVIFQTLKFGVPYDEIIDKMILSYANTKEKYREFLIKNSDRIKQVFRESGTENLRVIKTIIINFERVYAIWDKANVPVDYLPLVMYSYAANFYKEVCQKSFSKDQQVKDIFDSEEITGFSNLNDKGSSLNTLIHWIKTGDFQESLILQEIKERFASKNFTDKFKVLHWSIFDMDYSVTCKGLTEALDDAYAGNLEGNEMLGLFERIQLYETYSINFDFPFEYDKLSDGIDIWITRLKNEGVGIERRNFFVPSDYLQRANQHIRPLYEKMQYAESHFVAWENRKKVLECLNSNEMNLWDNAVYVDMFDDELLEAFQKKFENSNLRQKRYLEQYLLDLKYLFCIQRIEDSYREKEIATTKANLNILKDNIYDLWSKERDQIYKCVLFDFYEKLKTYLSKIQ